MKTLTIKNYDCVFEGKVRVFEEDNGFREIYKGTFKAIPQELHNKKIIGKPYMNGDNELIIDVKSDVKMKRSDVYKVITFLILCALIVVAIVVK